MIVMKVLLVSWMMFQSSELHFWCDWPMTLFSNCHSYHLWHCPEGFWKTMEWQYLFSTLFYYYVESHNLGTITDNICDSWLIKIEISSIANCQNIVANPVSSCGLKAVIQPQLWWYQSQKCHSLHKNIHDFVVELGIHCLPMRKAHHNVAIESGALGGFDGLVPCLVVNCIVFLEVLVCTQVISSAIFEVVSLWWTEFFVMTVPLMNPYHCHGLSIVGICHEIKLLFRPSFNDKNHAIVGKM